MTKTKTITQNQQIPQKVFEQWIELLIMYKQNNPDKDVTLSMNSLKKSIEWFNTMKDNMLKGVSKEQIKEVTDKIVQGGFVDELENSGVEKAQINKALEEISQ